MFLLLGLRDDKARHIIKVIEDSTDFHARSNVESISFKGFSFDSFGGTLLARRDLIIDGNDLIFELADLP